MGIGFDYYFWADICAFIQLAKYINMHFIGNGFNSDCYDDNTRKEGKLMKKSFVAAIAARIGKDTAKRAAGTASLYGYCQPKEPKMLKNIKK